MPGTLAHGDEAIVVGGRLPTGGIDVALVAVDPRRGQQLWRKELPGSSIDLLVAAGGRLYAGLGGRLVSLEPVTGRELWTAIEPDLDAPGAAPRPGERRRSVHGPR